MLKISLKILLGFIAIPTITIATVIGIKYYANLSNKNLQNSIEPSPTNSVLSQNFEAKPIPTPSPSPTNFQLSKSKPIKTASPSPSATATSTGPTPTAIPTSDVCSGVSNTSYDSVIIDDSPVAYFPFTESFKACDHTGNNHTGVYSTSINETTLPNGDKARLFDQDHFVTVSDNDDLSISTTGKLTIEAWIRPDVLEFTKNEGSGYVHWLGKGDSNNHEYLMRMYSYTNTESRPNRISGYTFNSSGGLGVGSYFQDTLTSGSWIHTVLAINTTNTSSTYPTGYTKIYKDGVQRDQDSLSSLSIVPSNKNAPLRIGTRDFNSYFQGAIGKVAIYNYELTAFQVLEHYQTMIPLVAGSAQYIQNVGSAQTKTTGTSMQITLTNAVSAGHTIIVRVLTDYSASAPTIADSKGNTYTRDRTAPNSGTTIRASIFSSPITTALEAGDTITITTANVAAKVAIADEFSGLLSSSYVDKQNGTSGSSTTPGTTISITTSQANELVLGFLASEGPLDDTYTEDALGQFSSLTREGTEGSTDDTNLTISGGYKSVSVIGTYQYKPTIDPSRNWISFILSYKAQ